MKEVFDKVDCNETKSEQFTHIYRELADLLGTEAAVKIHSAYRGQQINFPVNLFTKDFVHTRIKQEFNGKNVKALATKYGYSEKWVRKILKTKETD